jgi:hypothetical protein
VASLDEEISALSPEVGRHFGLDTVAGAGSIRALADLLDLAGRTVLVTGGGGADLGSMLCRRLAAQGANGAELSVGGGQSA